MNNFEKLYNKALRFLSFRPRSKKEIRDFLKRKKTSEEITEEIISKLEEHNFVNDLEFAKLWIEQRNKFRPRSLKLILIELKQKGIDQIIIDSLIHNSVLQQGSGQEFIIQNDKESAKKLLEKKLARLKGSREEALPKLQRLLASKGFSWDTIKEVIKDLQVPFD